MAPWGASYSPPKNPCEAMDRAKFSVGQRKAAQQADQGHILPCLGIAAVLEGRQERLRSPPQPFAAERIGDGIGKVERRTGSSTCVKASRPVLAVTSGGIE